MAESNQGPDRDATGSRAAVSLDPDMVAQLRQLERLTRPGIVAQLVATYLDNSARLAEALTAGVAASDLDAVRRASHSLKSTSASMGALAFSRRCGEIERAAREGRLVLDRDTLATLLDEHEGVRLAVTDLAERGR